MTDPSRIKALKPLTSAQYSAAQVHLAALKRKETGLRQNLTQLVNDRNEVANNSHVQDAARAAGAQIRWQKWVDQRRAIINTELAQIMAQKLESQRMLQRAFGKDQAIDALIKRQQRLVAQKILNAEI